MCTYQVKINDTLIENAKQAFPSQTAITTWMQQQLERMLKQLAVEQPTDKPLRSIKISDRIKSLSAVQPSDSHSDYKDEIEVFLSKKY